MSQIDMPRKTKYPDGYVGVRLPEALIKQIDELIEHKELGFATRAEFVKEAVRRYLLELEKRKE